jgi:uncharacterized protein (TIGR03000 family)
MVRGLLSISAVVAFGVLLFATESSQAQERRILGMGLFRTTSEDGTGYREPLFRRGFFRGTSEGYTNREPMMGRFARSTPEGTPGERTGILNRRSFYSGTAPISVRANEILFEVRAPEKAEIWFEGKKTEQTGTVRQYVSSGLTPGQVYTYELKAKWMEDGKEKAETKQIEVTAGQFKSVDLTKPAVEKLNKVPVKK